MLFLFISEFKPLETLKIGSPNHVFSLGHKMKTMFTRWQIDQFSEDFSKTLLGWALEIRIMDFEPKA